MCVYCMVVADVDGDADIIPSELNFSMNNERPPPPSLAILTYPNKTQKFRTKYKYLRRYNIRKLHTRVTDNLLDH